LVDDRHGLPGAILDLLIEFHGRFSLVFWMTGFPEGVQKCLFIAEKLLFANNKMPMDYSQIFWIDMRTFTDKTKTLTTDLETFIDGKQAARINVKIFIDGKQTIMIGLEIFIG